MQKLTIKTKTWMNALIFIALSVGIFYLSFVVKQNNLAISLFGLLFVLAIGLLATILERRWHYQSFNLLLQTATILALVNVLIITTAFFVFPENLSNSLIFSVAFTLAYIGFTFIKYKVIQNKT